MWSVLKATNENETTLLDNDTRQKTSLCAIHGHADLAASMLMSLRAIICDVTDQLVWPYEYVVVTMRAKSFSTTDALGVDIDVCKASMCKVSDSMLAALFCATWTLPSWWRQQIHCPLSAQPDSNIGRCQPAVSVGIAIKLYKPEGTRELYGTPLMGPKFLWPWPLSPWPAKCDLFVAQLSFSDMNMTKFVRPRWRLNFLHHDSTKTWQFKTTRVS